MSAQVRFSLIVLFICSGILQYASSKTVHIYPSTNLDSVLVNMYEIGRTNYSFDISLSDLDSLQVLAIERQSGAVRLNFHPHCKTLKNNPFVVYVRSFAVLKPSEQLNASLNVHVHGVDCFIKFRRRDISYTIIDREAIVGTRVVYLVNIFNPLPKLTSLKLLGGEATKYFRIDTMKRQLRLKRSLKLAESRVLEVTIKAFLPAADKSNRNDKSIDLRHLRVFIKNKNNANTGNRHRLRRRVRNNAPKFSNDNIVAQVSENARIGTTVTRISARDDDEGYNGLLSYTMSAQSNLQSNTMFMINSSSGVITTRRLLDREDMSRHYFTVKATDHGNPALSNSASLTIFIEDVNDNTPVFESSSYSKIVPENILVGDTVIEVRARDKDDGTNAQIHYSILNAGGDNSVFEIGQLTGSITVARELDREKVSSYSLQVKAEDQGRPKRSATTNVLITVSDVNDCKPVFSNNSYSVYIPENITRNSRVIGVSATDKDFGTNSEITYDILSGNDQRLFAMNSITGEIKVVGKLNYEAMPFYSLMVVATDKGQPPMFGQAMVDIFIIDVNDNKPIFVSSRFQAQIMENARVGSLVTHVQAFDNDDGTNKQIVYSLVQTNVPFTVNAQSGTITTTAKLDREKQSQYAFDVKATDKGDPPLSSVAQVSVTVTDINDNPPQFQNPVYYASVLENARWGTTLLRVSARDPDQGPSSVYYSIDDSTNSKKCFRMLPAGDIVLSCRLDYNRDKHYILSVQASDGFLKSTAVVYINVTDANTHPPVFNPAFYNVDVAEDVPIGHSVLKVTASDDDTGTNAKLSFSFVRPVPHFTIIPDTGVIKTASNLDRENKNTYSFQVLARDHGKPSLSGRASVFVSVTDVNDNAPRFKQQKYKVSIKEDFPEGKVVLQVSAVDDDRGKNKKIQYFLARDGNGTFKIDSSSGAIRTVKSLDRETIPSYNLLAVARDRGKVPKETSVVVTIELEDVKDSPPKFAKKKFVVRIAEDTKKGTKFFKAVAESKDLIKGSGVIYSIVSGNSPLTFGIGPSSGDIETLVPLDYEKKPYYLLRVRAVSAPYFDETTVNVSLIDINDNKPVLQDFYMRINVREENLPPDARYKIPAYDPDVNAELTYSISGNDKNFVSLDSSTGELTVKSTLINAMKPLKIGVTVNDGKYTDSATGFIMVTSVTKEMLNSSLTLYIDDTNVEDFLNNGLGKLTEYLAIVIPCDMDQIVFYDIKTEIIESKLWYEDDITRLTVWLTVRLKDNKGIHYGYFRPRYVKDRIYFYRDEISEKTGVKLLPDKDDHCLKEPYNDGRSKWDCAMYFVFGENSQVFSSPRMVFRTVPVKVRAIQSCPVGYRGKDCDTPLNLCYSSPCFGESKCFGTEKNYTCICGHDRTGRNCEINMNTSKCPPTPGETPGNKQLTRNPCMNEGSCINDVKRSFFCRCQNPEQVDTKYCELTTRSFESGSYIAFPALKQRWTLHVSLQFATTSFSGLLMYNGRYNDQHDFIAVELFFGQIRFSFSVGGMPVTMTTNVDGGVSDGEWHTVVFGFQNETGSIVVDNCAMGVVVQAGNHVGSFSCAAAARIPKVKQEAKNLNRITVYRSLDLTGPLMFGGLPPLSVKFPVSETSFRGCIRNVYIDRMFLDLGKPVMDNSSSVKCPAKKDFCKSKPCTRGVCKNSWYTFICKCPEGYGGKKCDIAMKFTWKFSGKSFIKKAYPIQAMGLTWSYSLKFRTKGSSGLLAEIQFPTFTAVLEISSGKLMFQAAKNGRVVELKFEDFMVNSGEWHNVDVTWADRDIHLTLDYIHTKGRAHDGITLRSDTIKPVQLTLFIGGKEVFNASKRIIQKGFEGCIQGVSINDTQINTAEAVKENVISGCFLPKHCFSSPCPTYATCVEGWGWFKCLCPPGYVGRLCKDVCSFKPCVHGQCVRSADFVKGFSCNCPRQYTGDLCETRKETPCPDKFFGAPTIGLCGPCTCQVGKNFSPVCNKTTGECYCKPRHYRLGDRCLPCNCEQAGSASLVCDPVTGKCPCFQGRQQAEPVLGRRCDQCGDKRSEIIAGKGCVVINTSCPRSYAEDIWFDRTSFGATATHKCPFGASGTATRYCDATDGWQKPVLLKCTSNSFISLRKKVEKLFKGSRDWSPKFSMELARNLDLSITLAPRLYTNDIKIAQMVLTKLFDYESQQNSTNLVSASEHKFSEILLQIASMLFNADNKETWSVIQENSAGTAELLQKMEDFSETLAYNIAHLKRPRVRRNTDISSIIPPYIVVTDNIVMELQALSMRNFQGRVFPESEDSFASLTHSPTWKNVTNKVELPANLFKTPGHSVSEENAAVGYMLFRNVGELLPKSFDTKITGTSYRVDVNSDVLSISVPGMSDVTLNEPIRIYFRNLQKNRSDTRCVFWNYSAPGSLGGGWSTDGCETESANGSRSICLSYHMTSFAVLSDLKLQYPAVAKFSFQIATYIGLGVSLLILVLAFLFFICLRSLKSNATTIHKHLIGAIIIAEAVFIGGINRTSDPKICRLIAILLHYFFSAVFTWMFVESLHMYRRLNEKRNVDIGQMTFYYFLGWGTPAVVVGISAGLSSEGYGNQRFCWMNVDGTLIWTFAVPLLVIIMCNLIVFCMALQLSLAKKRDKRRRYHKRYYDENRAGLTTGLRATVVMLPLLGVCLVFAILMVNQDIEMFHYLFAGLVCFQGIFIFLFYCLLDKTVRKEIYNAYKRWKTGDKTYGRKQPIQHFKRSYHPGEPILHAPYGHFADDEDGITSTSTTEHSSSVRSSTALTSSQAYSMTMSMPDDSSALTSGTENPADTDIELEKINKKLKFPEKRELELARKMWDAPEKSEHSTTQPDSSQSSDDEQRAPSPVIVSDSSDSTGEEGENDSKWPDENKGKKKKKRKTPFYASDGPMHSTPMDTTPDDEEPAKDKDKDEDSSSDTGDEAAVMMPPRQTKTKNVQSHKLTSDDLRDSSKTKEQEKSTDGAVGPVATTVSDVTPSVQEILKKKPLKSALKKPKAGSMGTPSTERSIDVASPTLNNETTTTTSSIPETPQRHFHHNRHRDRSTSRSRTSDGQEKKRKVRKVKHHPKRDSLVRFRKGEKPQLELGDPTEESKKYFI